MSRSSNVPRRSFLTRTLALPLLRRLSGQPARPVDSGFHFQPHYREPASLDATLRKTNAALDDFITEKYHDQVAAILAQWQENLLPSIETNLASDFRGCSPLPAESRIVRPGPALEVRRVRFSQEPALEGAAFVRQFRSALNSFTKILTTEFQVTEIETQPDGALRTRVRYELVGSGAAFHREQRVGWWELRWTPASANQFRLKSWRATDETRSRSAKPWYSDIAQSAFSRAPSYTDQMLRGVDDWRAVIDGASGIDIYGHNGVSAGDLHGDGFDDLYVCQPAGLPNRLYRNRGDGTFEDVTEVSGVGLFDNTACAIIADFDRDGRQDLVVVRAEGPLLFLNEGGGTFRLRPGAFQFAHPPQGTFTGAAAADYDRDGWLDIYFCLYVYYQGADQYKYPTPYFAAENGPPNFMMRNNRDGSFRDVTAQSGLNQNNTRYSFCCGWGDYNRDGWPDLFVVNDFGRKNLYRNNGDGTFTDVAQEAGVEDVGAGMSVCCFDYDNDGAEDLYVADMWTSAGERISSQDSFQKSSPQNIRALFRKHAMGNSLFRNQGNGRFEDATARSTTRMGRWSWSSDTWDFDHDGFADLYVVNGMVSGAVREDLNSFFWRQVVAKSPDDPKPSQEYEQGWNAINELIRADYTWSGYERNVFYVNHGDGTFSDVSGAVDLDFPEDGRSFALSDFDHDGVQEVLLKSRNAPQVRLLKNNAEGLPPSIAFRLRGVQSNLDAVGATVVIESESGRQTRMLQAGSGFLSQHSKDLFFGLGRAKGPVRASIRWPSGLVQQFENLPANHRISVEEGVASFRAEPFKKRAMGTPALTQARVLPQNVSTWLLTPVPAPDFSLPDSAGRMHSLSALRGEPAHLEFLFDRESQAVAIRLDKTPLRGTDDVAAIYNILYRYLFDRHRDLSLPVSFLIDAQGDIVKLYQGPVDPQHVAEDVSRIPKTTDQRLALALPFRGNGETYEFGRNNLSLGSVFFQRGYYDQAEASFRIALRDDPSSAEAHYGLGSVYLKQNKLGEARSSFERSLNMTASYPGTVLNAWNNLGLVATREGRTGDAIGHFQEALRINPDYWIALENLGNAYRQQKRWDEARAALERAVAARPQEPEANYSLAMVYAQMDDTDRAYQYLQKALALRPAYPEALNNLGVLFLRTRRRDEAVAKFEECVRVAPAFDQSYLNLARVYSLEGDREKARGVLRQLLQQHPGHAQAQLMLNQLQ